MCTHQLHYRAPADATDPLLCLLNVVTMMTAITTSDCCVTVAASRKVKEDFVILLSRYCLHDKLDVFLKFLLFAKLSFGNNTDNIIPEL